jgi:hypothetical protein
MQIEPMTTKQERKVKMKEMSSATNWLVTEVPSYDARQR